VIIDLAQPNDLDLLLMMRREAAEWLAAKELDQWASDWPDPDGMSAMVLRSVQDGTVWLVRDDNGTTIATLTLDTWANPDLWTPEEAAEPARYVHRLIVRRQFSGTGLGAELLDWCGTRAAIAGATWLRLDVWTANTKLQRYYLVQGFKHVRTRHLAHNPSGALFQRPARIVPTPRIVESVSDTPVTGVTQPVLRWENATDLA
jgi:GNAT superfamily N-acetyltransferase